MDSWNDVTQQDLARLRARCIPWDVPHDVEIEMGPDWKRLYVDGRSLCFCEQDEACEECDPA